MKRREFTAQVAAGLSLGLPAWAQAPGTPVEGTHYVRLNTPAAVPGNGKIDVIEFFWYGCPHCNAFEPMLDAWAKRLPPDVAFRRVHVAFTALHETHSKVFYALEALGQVEAMHRKVFAAIHQQRLALNNEAEIAAWMEKNGLDRAKFVDAYKSFGVATKVRQAKQLSEGYKIDGVPALGVHGRYYTSVSLAGGNDRVLSVADFLIQRARKGG
jgi:protein dithiol oxidoreductase (disulfide-forming)